MSTPTIKSLMERTRLLSGVPVFARSPNEILMGLAKLARAEQFDAGKVIIQEGEPGTRLFVITAGEVEVSCKSKEGTVILAQLGKNELFGEVAVALPNTPRTATVTSKTPVTAFSISSEDLDRMCAEHPPVRIKLAELANKILLLNFIKRSSPFSTLPADKVDELIKRLKLIKVPPKTIIVNQGERGHYCYLLKSGSVDVVLKDNQGTRQVATLFPGALFGEASLLTNTVRNAAVVSRDACEILAISRQDLFDAVITDQQLAARMMELLQLRDRPRRKASVTEQVVRQDERGESIVLKDAETGSYYRLTAEAKFIWDLLDGHRSLRDLTISYFEHFKAFSPHAIAEVVGGLGKAGFLESATWSDSVQKLLVRVPALSRAVGRVRKTLEFTVMRRHVDGWFSRWYQRIAKHLFFTTALVMWGVVAVAGIVIFGILTPSVLAVLPKYPPLQFLTLIPVFLLSILLHELGHGFAVKYFGREVMGVGVGWYWVTPIAFVDTSDMWLSHRWARIIVSLAGLAVNLVFAALFIIPALFLGASSHYTVYAWVFAAISYVVVFINLLPIRGTDGHYALRDYLDRAPAPAGK